MVFRMRKLFRTIWPAVAVLVLTMMGAFFLNESNWVKGLQAMGIVGLRFLRMFGILILTVSLLPGLCLLAGRLFRGERRGLIRIDGKEDLAIRPSKNWLIRPFQGIGLMMMMVTRLGGLFQAYSGEAVTFSELPAPGEYTLLRLLNLVLTSILLSFLWTMDDLGIRYYSLKSGEVRMIGKYLGVLLPLLTGLGGVASLIRYQTTTEASLVILQIFLISFPPFLIFGVFHTFYLTWRKRQLLEKLGAKSTQIRLMDS